MLPSRLREAGTRAVQHYRFVLPFVRFRCLDGHTVTDLFQATYEVSGVVHISLPDEVGQHILLRVALAVLKFLSQTGPDISELAEQVEVVGFVGVLAQRVGSVD